jgi:ABC-type branched-subunit amino acid transport system ATPase component
MTVATPALVAEGITSGYGEVPVVQDVSIHVAQNEIVTIIGPNGAGKSTVLKALFGFLPVWQGRVSLAGDDVTGLAPELLVCRGIAFVPQTDNGVEERISWVLELFPVLAERPRERAGRLSGGQRQTLAIARALMLEPRILLLDEPSASLSPKMVDTVLSNVVEINRRGTAVLMVEQRARQALAISDRGYVLANGRNRLEGPASDLLASDEVRRLYLGE